MYVGIDNSMVNESGRSPLCRVTLFAPFWLDNRTGMDLLFQDHKSAPPNPLFLGANSPFDYAEVESPGGFSAIHRTAAQSPRHRV